MGKPLTRQARAREIRVLSVLSAGTFLFFNSYGSINVAIPMIQAEFGSSLSAVQWIATMGLVLSASVALCLGRAGDILGRNRLYKLGVTLYGAGAALAAISHTFAQLVVCRVVMTVGLAMAMPMSTAITAAASHPERTGWSLGILLSAAGVGRATGPALGGFFIHLAGWRAVFLANAVIGLAVSVAVWQMLRGGERRSGESFDYPGAAALILGYPSILVGLSLGANSGWSSPLVPWWFLLGGAGMAAFVLRQWRARRPLIPLRLMMDIPLVLAFLTMVLFSAAYFPIFMLSPLYMNNVLELAPLQLGLILTTLPVVAALCSPVSGRLSDRVETWIPVAAGLAAGAIGIAIYAGLKDGSSPVTVLLALALVGIGVGVFLPAHQKIVFTLAPREHYGLAGGLLSACGPGAGALGIGLAVSLMEGTAPVDAAGFVAAQRVAMFTLLPLPFLALGLVIIGRLRGREKTPATPASTPATSRSLWTPSSRHSGLDPESRPPSPRTTGRE